MHKYNDPYGSVLGNQQLLFPDRFEDLCDTTDENKLLFDSFYLQKSQIIAVRINPVHPHHLFGFPRYAL